MNFRVAACALMAVWLNATPSSAQTYPTKPVTVIVPFAAGGPTDAVVRVLGERMRTSLGQTLVIENVAGGGGSLGVARAARAAPDGYTLSVGHVSTHVFNGAIYNLPFDLLKDFAPIALLPSNPMVVVAKKSLPANDLKEFIAWLKANEGKVSAGTAGVGSGSHVSAVYFQNVSGTRFQFVPYRGTGPALQDLVAGQIDLIVDQASNSLPQVRSGSIKAYAVTAPTRLASAPDIPTVDEAGLPGFHISIWYGLWAPKDTPEDIIAKLSAAAIEAMADPIVRQRFADVGLEIPPREQQSAASLGAIQRAEIAKWWPLIKAANIRSE